MYVVRETFGAVMRSRTSLAGKYFISELEPSPISVIMAGALGNCSTVPVTTLLEIATFVRIQASRVASNEYNPIGGL
jgi:hypothetical protein